jgi:cell division septation protein DedD
MGQRAMNQKIVGGLAVGAILIILLAVLYRLYIGVLPESGPSAVIAPGPPKATAPARPEPRAATPTQPAPPFEAAGPPKEAAPSPEPTVTILPPPAEKEHYGMLAGSYQKYADAAKMLSRLQQQGKPAFIQRAPRDLNLYQVWLGPFSSQGEAREAEKSLRAIFKTPLKIEPIENPVPK